jgi:hypothetical protein
MLSGITYAFDGFSNSRRIYFVSKIFATIVNGRYYSQTRFSKFFRLLLHTSSALDYPHIEYKNLLLLSAIAGLFTGCKGFDACV